MQKRLYEMEVTPPQAVWEKLSINIDEINADNRVAKKVLNAELTPPFSVWEKINSTINVVEKKPVQKKGRVINFRRVALAAILIGVIATSWVIFQNMNQKPEGIAIIPVEPAKKISTGETDTTKGGSQNEFVDSPIDLQSSKGSIVTIKDKAIASGNKKIISYNKPRKTLIARSSPVQFASLNTPLAKSFDRSIDDLSLVTSDQHYLTMVNSNGRLVKIPAELASLAPHLQDKPISEDIYEVMFGEGAYWKETLNEWRKKIASAPVTSGDAFTSLVELLKNVQNR